MVKQYFRKSRKRHSISHYFLLPFFLQGCCRSSGNTLRHLGCIDFCAHLIVIGCLRHRWTKHRGSRHSAKTTVLLANAKIGTLCLGPVLTICQPADMDSVILRNNQCSGKDTTCRKWHFLRCQLQRHLTLTDCVKITLMPSQSLGCRRLLSKWHRSGRHRNGGFLVSHKDLILGRQCLWMFMEFSKSTLEAFLLGVFCWDDLGW